MALRKMISRIRIRGGTYTQWDNANPVLDEREISFVVSGQNAGKFKVGDGVTPWRNMLFTAARFPEDILQLADQIASSALPSNGDIKQLFQQVRNYLKYETQTRAAADVALRDDLNTEARTRAYNDERTLEESRAYTDAAQLATQTWRPAVNQVSDLPVVDLNNKINYLCRVIADDDPANNGVYQAVAGWEDEPVWTHFSDNQDWIDPQELGASIAAHDQSDVAHQDIRDLIANGGGGNGGGGNADQDWVQNQINQQFGTYVPPNSDFNNLKTPGFYYNPADVEVATMANRPSSGHGAFGMIVFKASGIIQCYYWYNDPTIEFRRRFYDSAWSAWKQVVAPGHTHTPASIGAATASHSHGNAFISSIVLNGSTLTINLV